MRVIGQSALTLKDPYNDGQEITIFYNIPSTAQRVGWAAKASQLKENDPTLPFFTEIGREIITGFPDGTFGIDDSGKTRQIDSSPQSEHYAKDWRLQLFYIGSPNEDILAALGKFVNMAPLPLHAGSESKKK